MNGSDFELLPFYDVKNRKYSVFLHDKIAKLDLAKKHYKFN